MFDLDELIQRCITARADDDPHGATRDVLEWATSRSAELAETVGRPTMGISILHNDADLTILNVVWPPRMSLFPHDHRMWAAIGIYTGREDNAFFRRQGDDHIVESGGKRLDERDILLLGDDVIHAVANPLDQYTGAIHVYGGDFVATPRSQWDPDALTEAPWDLEAVQAEFARADAEFRAASGS